MAGQVNFQPTAMDFIIAARANYVRQLGSRRFFVRLAIAGGIAWLIMAGLLLFAGEGLDQAVVQCLYMGLISLAGVLVFIGLTWLLLPRRVRRLFLQSKSQHQPMTFGWSEHDSFWHTTHAEQNLPWSHYHRWRETGSVYLLYLNDTLYQFVPRHILTTEQDSDLRATLMASGLPRR